MVRPYRRDVTGQPSDISQVTRKQGSRFFATDYAPSNLTAIRVAWCSRLESNSGIRESPSQAESTGTSGNPFRTGNGPGPGPGKATVNPEW